MVVIVDGLREHGLGGKLALLARAHAALPGDGCLIAIETLIDDARRQCVAALLASLNARLELGDAFGFTGADFNRWCLDSGFRRTEVIALGETTSAAVASK